MNLTNDKYNLLHFMTFWLYVEDKMNLTMGDNLMTAEISFKGYGRL